MINQVLMVLRALNLTVIHVIRNCKYDGEPEYWVDVRESGEMGEEKEKKRQRTEVCEDGKVLVCLTCYCTVA